MIIQGRRPWVNIKRVFILSVVVLILIGVVSAASDGQGQGKAPPGGPDDTKIDVGVYTDVNNQSNPIGGDPDDYIKFTFDVVWVVTKTGAGGTPISTDTFYVGQYKSWQGPDNTTSYPTTCGRPYKDTYCTGFVLMGFCVGGDTVTEEGSYVITHIEIPYGYCPQYPFGQERKKDGTQTENMKFFKGDVCWELNPGFHGRFGLNCFPNICYILIQ